MHQRGDPSTSDEQDKWQPPLQQVRALRAVNSHIGDQQAAWLALEFHQLPPAQQSLLPRVLRPGCGLRFADRIGLTLRSRLHHVGRPTALRAAHPFVACPSHPVSCRVVQQREAQQKRAV